MIVFLKTSEEATCDSENVCNWQYTDTLPTITGAAPEFDAVNGKWLYKLTGSSLNDESGVLEISGVNQVSQSFSSNEIVFEITDVTSGSTEYA